MTTDRWQAELQAARSELSQARRQLINFASTASLHDHLDAAVDRYTAARGRVERTIQAAKADSAEGGSGEGRRP